MGRGCRFMYIIKKMIVSKNEPTYTYATYIEGTLRNHNRRRLMKKINGVAKF